MSDDVDVFPKKRKSRFDVRPEIVLDGTHCVTETSISTDEHVSSALSMIKMIQMESDAPEVCVSVEDPIYIEKRRLALQRNFKYIER